MSKPSTVSRCAGSDGQPLAAEPDLLDDAAPLTDAQDADMRRRGREVAPAAGRRRAHDDDDRPGRRLVGTNGVAERVSIEERLEGFHG
jgi:hypothetical protein